MERREQLKFTGAFHEKWGHIPVDLCLKMRGFYVKIGQIMSGQPELCPKAYRTGLIRLQEDVPPQAFSTIRDIVEEELGKKLEDVFEHFEETPIGAASIGQVHNAKLKGGGEEVVVKVQYPETERFFQLDFRTIAAIFGVVNPEMAQIVEEQEDCFAQVQASERSKRAVRTPAGGGEDLRTPRRGHHEMKCDGDEGMNLLFKALAALATRPVVVRRSNTRRGNHLGL